MGTRQDNKAWCTHSLEFAEKTHQMVAQTAPSAGKLTHQPTAATLLQTSGTASQPSSPTSPLFRTFKKATAQAHCRRHGVANSRASAFHTLKRFKHGLNSVYGVML